MLYKQRIKRYSCFVSAMLLIASAMAGSFGLILQSKVSASPPNTVELTGYNPKQDKNTLIECKLRAGTVTFDQLKAGYAGVNDTYSTFEGGRYRNYSTAESSQEAQAASGYDNQLDTYFDKWGDRDGSPAFNYISAVSTDGNGEKDYICASTLMYIQDPINTNFFYGLLVSDDQNDKGCTASLSVSDFASGTAKIGSLWRAPTPNCSNTPDYSDVSMNIEGLTIDFKNGTVGGGGTGTGGGLNYSQATDFRWVDLETIQSGVNVVRAGFRAIETYKWDSYWGADSSRRDIVYKLVNDPATPLTEERAKLIDGRSDASTNKSCVPYIQFTQDGGSGNDNKMDINLDNGDKNYGGDFNAIAALLNRSTVQGHFYDKGAVGGGCTSNEKKNIDVNSTKLKLWFEYYPDTTSAQLIFNQVLNREQEYNHIYKLEGADHSILTMESQTCVTAKTQLRLVSDITTASVNEVVGGDWQVAIGCNDNTEETIAIPILVRVMAGTPPTLPAPETPPPGEESAKDCEAATASTGANDGWGFWICPLLRGTDKLIGLVEGQIKQRLQVGTEFTTNEDLHTAWINIARISSGLLVIVAFVMIISTALGAEVVSSYTMKKMLPRIVIGAIGIWLSWALATTYINFMNDLGNGIAGLLYSPFKASTGLPYSEVNLQYIVGKILNASGTAADDAVGGTGIVLAGFGLVSLISGTGGIFGILAMAVPVVVALLIGLFLLSLREVIIVFLLVLAPIGIAAWMLPNTNKVWKLWSGTFNKLLLLYPLFMGTFAAGKIFAIIATSKYTQGNGDGGIDNIINAIIPIIAYVSPFFFIPALFKLAGSTFGNITGMVNNKGKGAVDKLTGNLKKRSALSQGSLAKAQREKLRTSNKVAKFADKMTGGGMAAIRRRRYGGFLNSEDTRNKLQAGAWAAVNADTENTIKGFETLLENQFRSSGKTNEGDWLQEIAKNSKGEMRQAAIGRMAKSRSVGNLEALHSSLSIGERGGDWAVAMRRKDNSEALREAAPHLFKDSTGRTLDYSGMSKASSESAAKWQQATWESYAANNDAAASAAAQRVAVDPQARRLLSPDTKQFITSKWGIVVPIP